MMFRPNVITGPTKEPVSTEEVRVHLNIDELDDLKANDQQEDKLTSFIKAARFYMEATCGRTIHEQTLELVLHRWPAEREIILPRATPLIDITSLAYKDSTEASSTVAASEYIADVDQTPGRLVLGYGKSWPSATLSPASPIKVRYRAGIATSSPVAECGDEIKTPILLLVGGMWENRESEVMTDMKAIEAMAMRYGINKMLTELLVTGC